MIKKLTPILFLSIGIIACNESKENNTETKTTTKEDISIDTLVSTIELESVEPMEVSFSYFEDYSKILTKDDLISQFGKENIKDQTSWYAEGTVERQSSTLTNPNNNHIIKFIWDENTNSKTSWIEANFNQWDENYENTGTQTLSSSNSLALGMSLNDLKKWNNADFKFSGFGWDYAGQIFTEPNSKLAESEVQIILGYDYESTQGSFEFIIGDVELNSNDEKLTEAPIFIEQMIFYLSESNGE